MAINYARLISLCESKERTQEAFAARAVRPTDLDMGRLFAECFGWHEFQQCRLKNQTANDVMTRALTEAAGAVTTSAFLNITGQFVYQTVLDAYENEEFVFTKQIPERPASTLQGEKIPGITAIGDEALVRPENDPYTLVGVGEDWIYTPQIQDRGMIVPLTWEAVFNDKTGQLNDRASDVGYWMGVNVEKRAIDCIIDENLTDPGRTHRYNWKGVTIASYNDNTGSHTWDNLAASNGLVDWTDLDTVDQLFNAITDPYTGEPIQIEPKHLVVTKQNQKTAERILHATEIRVATPGFATTANPTVNVQANPYANALTLLTSRLLAARMATDTTWYMGDIGKYAKRMVAEKLNVVQAPPNNHDEFHRRIVAQHRVNEQSAFVVVNPRYMVKSTA